MSDNLKEKTSFWRSKEALIIYFSFFVFSVSCAALMHYRNVRPCFFTSDEKITSYFDIIATSGAGFIAFTGIILLALRAKASDQTAYAAIKSLDQAREIRLSDELVAAIKMLAETDKTAKISGAHLLENIRSQDNERIGQNAHALLTQFVIYTSLDIFQAEENPQLGKQQNQRMKPFLRQAIKILLKNYEKEIVIEGLSIINQAHFEIGKVTEVIFCECIFETSTFTNNVFINCNFNDCAFDRIIFNNCVFINCKFNGCSITDCTFNEVTLINRSSAMKNENLIEQANQFKFCIFTGTKIIEDSGLSAIFITRSDVSGLKAPQDDGVLYSLCWYHNRIAQMNYTTEDVISVEDNNLDVVTKTSLGTPIYR